MKRKAVQEIQEILKKYTVGIAGAGGLGSNCAVALVRSGIGKLVIVDFDTVDESNLNRQYYFRNQIGEKKVNALASNIYAIDNNITLEIHDLKLNMDNIPTIFSDCDIIVEAFDNADMKQLIIEIVLEKFPDKPIIVGNGMAGWGDSNSLEVKKYDNLYVCGDRKSEVSIDLPPLAARVGIVANMQANQVLEILLNKE